MDKYNCRGWRHEGFRHSLAARGIRTYRSKKHEYSIAYKRSHSPEYDMEFVGVDRKGRRVRKYGDDHWRTAAREKYSRVGRLKEEFPRLMGEMRKDMRSEDAETRKNARAAYVIAKTGMRPGTRKEMHADQRSFGVTTLRKDQVVISGDDVKFRFTGKHGIPVNVDEHDGTLASELRKQKNEVEGEELFPHASDATVRNYLYKHGKFKPKDFRTLKANHIAEKMVKEGYAKPKVTAAVARQLANTPSVAENSYIDKKVFR